VRPFRVTLSAAEFMVLRRECRGEVPLVVRNNLVVIESGGRRQKAVAQFRWEDVILSGSGLPGERKADMKKVRW